jgi:hypothetical protein
MKNIFTKFVSAFTVITLLTFLVGPTFANAASLSGISDTMSREMIGTASTHKIVFKSTSAIGVGTAGITLSIPYGTTTTFTGGTFVAGDILGICHGPSTGLENGYGTNCTANNETLSTSSGANQWGFTTSGSNPVLIVLTAPSTTFTHTIAAGDLVTIFLASTHMINPANTATPTISISTTSDTGSFTVPIVDSDQVTVTASVNETISFDLDAAADFHNDASNAPYSVPLGTLTTSSVTHSDNSSIRMIVINGSTNGSGGINVTVQNANGANGLVSTSATSDKIPSTTATMAANTANYGLCVDSATLSGFARATAYNTTCALSSGTNAVVGLTSTPASIVGTTTQVNAAKAEVVVNAAISGATPAHTDYADTLTFVGTGTF